MRLKFKNKEKIHPLKVALCCFSSGCESEWLNENDQESDDKEKRMEGVVVDGKDRNVEDKAHMKEQDLTRDK